MANDEKPSFEYDKKFAYQLQIDEYFVFENKYWRVIDQPTIDEDEGKVYIKGLEHDFKYFTHGCPIQNLVFKKMNKFPFLSKEQGELTKKLAQHLLALDLEQVELQKKINHFRGKHLSCLHKEIAKSGGVLCCKKCLYTT